VFELSGVNDEGQGIDFVLKRVPVFARLDTALARIIGGTVNGECDLHPRDPRHQ
jgi:hypothetical protein